MFLSPAIGDIDTASATEYSPFTRIAVLDFFNSLTLFAILIEVSYLSSPQILSIFILLLLNSFSIVSYITSFPPIKYSLFIFSLLISLLVDSFMLFLLVNNIGQSIWLANTVAQSKSDSAVEFTRIASWDVFQDFDISIAVSNLSSPAIMLFSLQKAFVVISVATIIIELIDLIILFTPF